MMTLPPTPFPLSKYADRPPGRRRIGGLSFAALLLVMGCDPQGAATTTPDAAPTAFAVDEGTGEPAATTREWVKSAPTPMLDEGITSFGAAAVDGRVYVLGGYQGQPHQYDRTGQSGRFRALDLASGAWEELPGVEHLQSVELVEVGGALLRIGGMRALNDPGTPANMQSLDEVERFDPAKGTWAPATALPKPRSSHAAAVVDGKVYVVGGWRLTGKAGEGEFADTTLVRAPDGTWSTLPQPFKRRAVGAGAVGKYVVALGGLDDGGTPSKRVDLLDTATRKWIEGPEFPGEGFGAAAQGVGDRLIASGVDGRVFALDPEKRTWTEVDRLAFPRFFHQLVPGQGDDLLAVGGIHGMTVEDRIRAIETVATTPEGLTQPRVLTWTLDAPGPAKNRQAIFLRGDSLYLFGGNRSLGQHDFEPEHFTDAGVRLHLTSMRWSEIAPLPVQRQSLQTTLLGARSDTGLAVGGFGHDGSDARTHPEAFTYDFGKNAWSEAATQVPGSRTQFGLAAHEGELWIFGGLEFDPTQEGAAMFKHVTPVLKTKADAQGAPFEPAGVDLTGPRRAFAGATLDGRYYMAGGMKDGFEPVPTFEAFDFETRTWKTLAAPSKTRIGADLIPIGGALYLVGGTLLGDDAPKDAEADGTAKFVERYDPKKDEWSTVIDELPVPLRHARAFAYGDAILLVNTHHEADVAEITLIRP